MEPPCLIAETCTVKPFQLLIQKTDWEPGAGSIDLITGQFNL